MELKPLPNAKGEKREKKEKENKTLKEMKMKNYFVICILMKQAILNLYSLYVDNY